MVAVSTGELSPVVSGIVYCGVILGCQAAYEVRRALEWTAALTKWCQQQPDMVAFTGRCLVHRAEILRLQGAWAEALEEAQRASRRCVRGTTGGLPAKPSICRGISIGCREISPRRRTPTGRRASSGGSRNRASRSCDWHRAIRRRGRRDPPGSWRDDGAPEARGPAAALVEIMLAVDDVEEARSACLELEEIAAAYEGGMLDAVVAHTRGAVDQAEGNTEAALMMLRRAFQAWQEFEAPYEAARARTLVAQACRALGDNDAAAMELDAARDAFTKLGAGPTSPGSTRSPPRSVSRRARADAA